MSRTTNTDFPAAYRVVITRTLGGHEATEYHGPYMTIGAAKGILTGELRERSYEHYDAKTGHVEIMTGNWRKVAQ